MKIINDLVFASERIGIFTIIKQKCNRDLSTVENAGMDNVNFIE